MRAGEEREQGTLSDKDAYLYDKMLEGEKGAPEQGKEPQAQQPKVEQPKEAAPANTQPDAIKQEPEGIREPLQVEITQDQENEMRGEMNDSLIDSPEQLQAFIQGQKEAMREQMNIAELEEASPIEIAGKQEEPVQPQQTTTIANRK